ncbi:hypothetical protein SAMN05443287_10718 [Micromonospora phaseoli]|uniref:DUF4190 domain-containing protein n=1 Tax=Micromonospora phaseoli TaxID=1144548 RepID=A0A1H7B7J6_9ACTN|nr:hypothetical protein CLV64_108344 [Micromonospora phaseoli]GIJ79020.1 hypothetical protein Xph01_34520 [Micromonospora phaseoli]SEJ72844.1 hypothetical protein SAMN05443287_10718 [Micromonospora phaseoli]
MSLRPLLARAASPVVTSFGSTSVAEEGPVAPQPRNGLGATALIVGATALAFACVPVIGEFIAAPAAVLAIVLGLLGLGRTEKGQATNPGQALAGGVLGLTAGFLVFLVLIATMGPNE